MKTQVHQLSTVLCTHSCHFLHILFICLHACVCLFWNSDFLYREHVTSKNFWAKWATALPRKQNAKEIFLKAVALFCIQLFNVSCFDRCLLEFEMYKVTDVSCCLELFPCGMGMGTPTASQPIWMCVYLSFELPFSSQRKNGFFSILRVKWILVSLTVFGSLGCLNSLTSLYSSKMLATGNWLANSEQQTGQTNYFAGNFHLTFSPQNIWCDTSVFPRFFRLSPLSLCHSLGNWMSYSNRNRKLWCAPCVH